MSNKKRRCLDCGRDISDLHHNAKRCRVCARIRKKNQDKLRQRKNRFKKLKWQSFIEDKKTGELTHKNAKGSKIRYWLDKICKILTTQELDFLLNIWNNRVKQPSLTQRITKEFKTCAGIVKDWRDYFLLKEQIEAVSVSYDSTTGVIFQPDGTYTTVDFDEEKEMYIIRDSEGTIIN